MALRYCSLHGRLFSYTYQCWVPFPEEKIHDIKGYSALLRATKTEAFALHVVETGCDACAATCRRGGDEHIAFPQDQTLKAAAGGAHA